MTEKKKRYESVEETQADLDAFIEFYNLKRSHPGFQQQMSLTAARLPKCRAITQFVHPPRPRWFTHSALNPDNSWTWALVKRPA